MATKEEVVKSFTEMVGHFKAEKAEGVSAIIQFDLSGDAGGLYWVKIDGAALETGEGAAANPNMTFKSSADDFAALVDGKLNPMQAFMMGKVKVTDVGLAMKMMNIFALS